MLFTDFDALLFTDYKRTGNLPQKQKLPVSEKELSIEEYSKQQAMRKAVDLLDTLMQKEQMQHDNISSEFFKKKRKRKRQRLS